MDKIIRKHYFKSFYIITLIFSFFLLLLHFLLPMVGNYSVSFTQWSPLLAVVFIALILKDKSIFNDIKKQITKNKNNLKWLLPALMIPSFLIFISSIIMSALKIKFVVFQGNIKFYLISLLAIFIGSITEEIGWRGFLLPNIQKKYSPLISSIIVGLLWGVWHFNFTGGILGFILYIVTIIEISIMMTWLYNKTNRNLLLMIIWHFSFNLSSHIFLWDRFNLTLYIIQSLIFAIPCLFIVLFKYKKR